MTADFLRFICEQLWAWRRLRVPPSAVIDLDASNAAKFSRQLIIRCSIVLNARFPILPADFAVTRLRTGGRMDECTIAGDQGGGKQSETRAGVFSNNVAAGRFVQRAMAVLAVRSQSEFSADGGAVGARRLWVWPKGRPPLGTIESGWPAGRKPFVDTGVYTRNRCFRLYGCSKYGNKDRARKLRRAGEVEVTRLRHAVDIGGEGVREGALVDAAEMGQASKVEDMMINKVLLQRSLVRQLIHRFFRTGSAHLTPDSLGGERGGRADIRLHRPALHRRW